jgi:outer membrane lipoprotein-sorting protein
VYWLKIDVFLFIMKRFYLFFAIFLAPALLLGQTAVELTREIEKAYLTGEAVQASFDLAGEKKITLTASLISSKYKYESSSETITNNGAEVTNYNKKLKQATINESKANSQNSTVATQDFFRFSTNYISSILTSKGSTYQLELTPKESLKKIYQQAGISSLIMEVARNAKKGSIKIKSILTNSKGIKQKAGNVKITSIAKQSDKLFTLSLPKDVKIVDLRD